jgi:hypothetical protein
MKTTFKYILIYLLCKHESLCGLYIYTVYLIICTSFNNAVRALYSTEWQDDYWMIQKGLGIAAVMASFEVLFQHVSKSKLRRIWDWTTSIPTYMWTSCFPHTIQKCYHFSPLTQPVWPLRMHNSGQMFMCDNWQHWWVWHCDCMITHVSNYHWKSFCFMIESSFIDISIFQHPQTKYKGSSVWHSRKQRY